MPVSISIDNNRATPAIFDPLIIDQSAGLQDNDVNLGFVDTASPSDPLTGAGYHATFLALINGLSATQLTEAQKAFAATVEGAISNTDFVQVTAGDEEVSDLFFSGAGGAALNGVLVTGMTTLAGDPIYLWAAANSDFAIATTSNVSSTAGRVVAAFYLNEAANHLSAQVQMVTFEPIDQPLNPNPDESLNFTDALKVSASSTLTFSFDNLDSGNFLYAAFGTTAAGLIMTGEDLNVNDVLKQNGTPGANFGEEVSGGSDSTDTMNTSQGGVGATIGVNTQDFRDGGGTAVVTLVTGFIPLTGITDGSTFGHDVRDILYDQYINTTSASIFLSQQTGSDASGMTVSLWEAGGNNNSGLDPSDNATGSLVAEEGYGPVPNPALDNTGYIGDDATDVQLKNDWPVPVASVTIARGGIEYTWTAAGGSPLSPPTYQGVQLLVTFNGNEFTVVGMSALDKVTFTAADDPNNALDGTFNRFKIEGTEGNFDIGAISLSQGATTPQNLGGLLRVDDDGPAFVAPFGGDPANPIDDGYVQYVTGDSDTNALNGNAGTDASGVYTVTDFTESFTYLGHTVIGTLNGDSTAVHYFEDNDDSGDFNAGDVDYYTMSLTPAGSYTFSVNNAPTAPPLTFDFDDLPSGSNLFGSVADSADGPGLFVFGRDPVLSNNTKYNNASDVIHTSQGGINATIGVNNQMFDPGEGAYFTFVDDVRDSFLSGVSGGLSATEADLGKNLLYDGGLHDTDGAILGISQIQAGSLASMDLTAYSLDSAFQGVALINNRGDPGDAAIVIDHVIVYDETGAKIEDTGDLGNFDDGTVEVIFNADGSVSVNNLDAGYRVEWETVGDTFNQVLVEATGGKFDIGFFGLSESQEIPDQFLNFTARLTDGDGDHAEDSFQVHVDATPFIV